MNILHILSDQHLATCLGCAGHPQAITPNMDRLAKSGVHFSHAYTQNPICTPSRVSMLSGQYCHNHGFYGLSGPSPQSLPCYLGHFKRHGYRTAGIGKLHTPNEPEDWLLPHVDLYAECYEYGRDDCYLNDPAASGSAYFAYLERLGLRGQEDSVGLPELPGSQQHEARPSELPYRHSVEGWCVQTAKKFINDCDGARFCMQVSLPRPHQCYTPDRRFWDMYPADLDLPPTLYNDDSGRPAHFREAAEQFRNGFGAFEPTDYESWARRVWRGYLACLTQVDFALGELLDFLEERGLDKTTTVIYNSDHGAYSGTFGIPEKAPGICSEAVCRVPMIWRVPGVTPANRLSGALVENIDIAPTIAALCALPAMETVDGHDISSILSGDDTAVRAVAVTENPWSKSLRWKNWRFVHYQRAMFGGAEVGELYDIENDPDETRNLFHDAASSEVLAECRQVLLEWLIMTTRIKTAWPPVGGATQGMYRIAEDGKESNLHGPAARVGVRLDYL